LRIILDASSAINLVHGEVLGAVLRLPGYTFCIGPQVLEECEGEAEELRAAVAQGRLTQLDDSQLSGSSFVELLEEYGLGLGETECLAFALRDQRLSFSSDDRKARATGKAILGGARVLGTLFLLRECVQHHLLTSEAARTAYDQMIERGGFLPDLPTDYFDQP